VSLRFCNFVANSLFFTSNRFGDDITCLALPNYSAMGNNQLMFVEGNSAATFVNYIFLAIAVNIFLRTVPSVSARG
jgi:hypothetical protein